MTSKQKAQAYVDYWWEKELNKMNVKENKVKEQDKRQKELDKQLDEQLTETIALVRKLRKLTEDNQLTMKEISHYLLRIEGECAERLSDKD